MEQIIVTARAKPDLDGLAAAIGYAYLRNQQTTQKEYFVWFSWTAQYEARYVLAELWLSGVYRDIQELEHSAETYYVLVDYSERNGISNLVVPERTREVIDHKSFPLYDDFPNARFRIEYVGAAATLVAEEYFFGWYNLPNLLATLLYAAIYSNTLHFTSRMSWFRDRRMADWLRSFSLDTDIVSRMTLAKTRYAERYMLDLLRDDDKLVLLDNGLLVDYLQIEVGDATGLLTHISDIEDALHALHTEEDVLGLLHIHDITKKKTYVLSNYQYFLWYLHTSWFPWELHDCYIELPSIYLRKDTIPMLQNILSHVWWSLILQEFLS